VFSFRRVRRSATSDVSVRRLAQHRKLPRKKATWRHFFHLTPFIGRLVAAFYRRYRSLESYAATNASMIGGWWTKDAPRAETLSERRTKIIEAYLRRFERARIRNPFERGKAMLAFLDSRSPTLSARNGINWSRIDETSRCGKLHRNFEWWIAKRRERLTGEMCINFLWYNLTFGARWCLAVEIIIHYGDLWNRGVLTVAPDAISLSLSLSLSLFPSGKLLGETKARFAKFSLLSREARLELFGGRSR